MLRTERSRSHSAPVAVGTAGSDVLKSCRAGEVPRWLVGGHRHGHFPDGFVVTRVNSVREERSAQSPQKEASGSIWPGPVLVPFGGADIPEQGRAPSRRRWTAFWM